MHALRRVYVSQFCAWQVCLQAPFGRGVRVVCIAIPKDLANMDLAAEADLISQAIPRLAERVDVVPNDNGTFNLRGPKLRRHPINRWFAWLLRLPQQVEGRAR